MAVTDKYQAIVNFLKTSPTIEANPLFFNFGTVEDGAHQTSTRADDASLNRVYIDGSVLKRYTFLVDSFKSVAYNPVITNLSDENLEDLAEVQSLLDWVNEMGDAGTFPEFGDKCTIESMRTLTSKPELMGVDTTLTPPMAIYRTSIQIDYIDYSKKLWN